MWPQIQTNIKNSCLPVICGSLQLTSHTLKLDLWPFENGQSSIHLQDFQVPRVYYT